MEVLISLPKRWGICSQVKQEGREFVEFRSAKLAERICFHGSADKTSRLTTMKPMKEIAEILHYTETSNTHEEEVMTKTQAAGFMQVSKRTLDSHMKKGWIPFSKFPSGAIRFRRSQLVGCLDTYQHGRVSL